MSWSTVALGDICAPKQWKTLSKKELLEDGHPVFGANGQIGYYNKSTHDRDTLLVGCRGSCGTIHIMPAKGYANGNAMALGELREDIVSLNYLARFLKKRGFADVITGTSQPQIIKSTISAIEIPLPPLEEQRRIAGILDAADALRRRRREALALLDTLPGAIFAEMFGDCGETYTLKEAGTDFRYGTSSKSQDHGLPVLRIPNVVGGDVDLSEIKTVPLSAKEEARFALMDGDILLVRTNGNQAYVGRSAVFNREKVADHELSGETWSFASYLIRARLKEKELLPDFIQGFLSSAAGRKQLLASSKTSAGQFNINTEALGAIRVPKVAVPAQAAFVDRVAEIKNHRRQVLGHLSELENLFASLQSRAFAGEL